ncbi:MAG: LamG domain-containing protein, partial [Candidatus Taylorbacteria bacterium]|nr:LamG domain-containing protein [Candidatus Taylorbacteria bacterium]
MFALLVINFGIANIAEAGLIFKAPSSIGLISGLVGSWSFNDSDMAGNTAYDRSGNANNGTLTNGPVRAIGKIGQALNFDGVDDYVNAGRNSILDVGSNNFSVGGWIKTAGNPSAQAGDAGYGLLVTKGSSGVGGKRFGLWGYRITSGFPAFNLDDDVAEEYFEGTTNIDDGNWHLIYGVRDGNTARIYVDGKQDGSTDITGLGSLTDTSKDLIFSAESHDPVKYFVKGSIDDVRVYNRALTADEIKRLYKIGGTLKLGSSKAQNTGSLTQGLVGYWSFDESTHGTTSVADLSGNNNRGHLINGPQKAIGKLGQALSFDGGDDYVDMGDPANGALDFGTGSFTLSAWLKISTASVNLSAFIEKGANTPTETGYSWMLSGGKSLLAISDGTNRDLLTGIGTINDNVWHHVAVVINRSTSRVITYIDGKQDDDDALASVTGNVSNSLNFCLGRRQAACNVEVLTGSMDDVRIYNRVLTGDEIKRLYRIGATLKLGNSQAQNTGSLTQGLVGYWSFDEPDMAGVTAYDRSGQANNGTLTNGPTRAIGKIGQGLSFDGVNDYVNMGNAAGSLRVTSTLTFSAWVKIPATAIRQAIMGRGTDAGLVIEDTTSRLRVWATPSSTGVGAEALHCTAGTAIDNNVFHHVVLTYDTSIWRAYVDGVQDCTGTGVTGTLRDNSSDGTVIGFYNGDNSYAIGLIDDVR